MKRRKKDTQTRNKKKRKGRERKKKEKWENGRIDEGTNAQMHGRTDGRMDGWMDGWMDEWVSEWVSEIHRQGIRKKEEKEKRLDRRINEGTNAHTHGRTDGWRDEGVSEWVSEWMKEWMNEWREKKLRKTDGQITEIGSLVYRQVASYAGVLKAWRSSLERLRWRLISISNHRELLNSWSRRTFRGVVMSRTTCDLIHLQNVTPALTLIHTNDREKA